MCPAVAMQLQIYLKHGSLLPKADIFLTSFASQENTTDPKEIKVKVKKSCTKTECIGDKKEKRTGTDNTQYDMDLCMKLVH